MRFKIWQTCLTTGLQCGQNAAKYSYLHDIGETKYAITSKKQEHTMKRRLLSIPLLVASLATGAVADDQAPGASEPYALTAEQMEAAAQEMAEAAEALAQLKDEELMTLIVPGTSIPFTVTKLKDGSYQIMGLSGASSFTFTRTSKNGVSVITGVAIDADGNGIADTTYAVTLPSEQKGDDNLDIIVNPNGPALAGNAGPDSFYFPPTYPTNEDDATTGNGGEALGNEGALGNFGFGGGGLLPPTTFGGLGNNQGIGESNDDDVSPVL